MRNGKPRAGVDLGFPSLVTETEGRAPMPLDPEKERRIVDDRPPFFRGWGGVYGAVLGFLAFLVLVFYLFTRHYR